jgi:hypothetical protein
VVVVVEDFREETIHEYGEEIFLNQVACVIQRPSSSRHYLDNYRAHLIEIHSF